MLVLGAMFTLVGRGVFPVLPVAIIAVREVVISLYRTFAAKGVSIPATPVAKLKTVFQQLAVGVALCPVTAVDGRWLWMTLLWVAVVLTVVSGAHYLLRAPSLRSRWRRWDRAGEVQVAGDLLRGRCRRDGAPARPDRRHELGVAG